MKIGVFGATNDIGRGIADELRARDHEVVLLGRDQAKPSEKYVLFDLEKPMELAELGFDSVVLVSWIGHPRTQESMQKNLDGYRFLAGELQRAKIFPIFISTVTANPNSRSLHSRTKFQVESFFSSWGSIIRLGQVLTGDVNVAGKSANLSNLLSIAGRAIRTNFTVPTVQMNTVVREVSFETLSQTPRFRVLIDGNRRLGGTSVLAIPVPRKFLQLLVAIFALHRFYQRHEILDRWYALIDYRETVITSRSGFESRNPHTTI